MTPIRFYGLMLFALLFLAFGCGDNPADQTCNTTENIVKVNPCPNGREMLCYTLPLGTMLDDCSIAALDHSSMLPCVLTCAP